jgi:hypothetical protein
MKYVYLDGRGDEPPSDEEATALLGQTDRIVAEMNTPGTPRYQLWQEMTAFFDSPEAKRLFDKAAQELEKAQRRELS